VWVDDNGVLGSVRVVRDFEEGRRMKTMIQIKDKLKSLIFSDSQPNFCGLDSIDRIPQLDRITENPQYDHG